MNEIKGFTKSRQIRKNQTGTSNESREYPRKIENKRGSKTFFEGLNPSFVMNNRNLTSKRKMI